MAVCLLWYEPRLAGDLKPPPVAAIRRAAEEWGRPDNQKVIMYTNSPAVTSFFPDVVDLRDVRLPFSIDALPMYAAVDYLKLKVLEHSMVHGGPRRHAQVDLDVVGDVAFRYGPPRCCPFSCRLDDMDLGPCGLVAAEGTSDDIPVENSLVAVDRAVAIDAYVASVAAIESYVSRKLMPAGGNVGTGDVFAAFADHFWKFYRMCFIVFRDVGAAAADTQVFLEDAGKFQTDELPARMPTIPVPAGVSKFAHDPERQAFVKNILSVY